MAGPTLIIALDFPSERETLAFLDQLKKPAYVKVGMELFYREGPAILQKIKARGHRIFLDLKLHDIPNTVKSAMRNLAFHEVDMVNLHGAGGVKMMRQALEGLEEGSRERGKRPLCIAVTQLTSTGEDMLHKELLIGASLPETVEHYARMAKEAGLDGVVCSVHEAKRIHQVCGEGFLTVTPGIRPAGRSADDQVRVASPAYAREQGCDYVVVGRPITQAEDKAAAYENILRELEGIPGKEKE